MTGRQATSTFARGAIALALALLLALRLLSPAGFMPAFDRGAVTIVACPDGTSASSMTGHDHRNAKPHQLCPYAAAAGLSGLAGDPSPLIALLVVGLALLLGRPFTFLARQRALGRPRSRGPPIPA